MKLVDNIFVTEDNAICYIDFGMMGVLDDEFRQDLAELMINFSDHNIDGLINQLIRMDILNEKTDINSKSEKTSGRIGCSVCPGIDRTFCQNVDSKESQGHTGAQGRADGEISVRGHCIAWISF